MAAMQRSAAASCRFRRSAVFRSLPGKLACGTAAHLRRHRSSMQIQAVLAPEAAAAVSQQATAFAVVLAAEGAFSRSNVPDTDKGRPAIPQIAAGVAGSLAAALLVKQDGSFISTLGVVFGFAVSAFMLFYNAQRAIDLQYNDGDWPGPKAWPAGMSLISFLALCVFFQALVADISTPV